MIPLMKSAFYNEYETKQELAKFILKAPVLSMGSQCFEFEKEFARVQGRKEAVLFNSGGSANLAMIQAFKNLGYLKEGDKIGFSALTWSTNVMPILQLGFIPVPIDCDPDTINVMSYNLADRMQQVDIKAFFATNVLGFLGDLDKIKEICNTNGIIFIEDNCESLGSEIKSGKSGNFGIAASFSFFVAHHMSTIEGGMVCTDDTDIAEMLRIVRANGWDRNLHSDQQQKWRKRYNVKSEFIAKYTFYDLGFNLRPTEITGFLGQYQLKYIEEVIDKRHQNFKCLNDVIEGNEELVNTKHDHLTRLSIFSIPVITKNTNLREKYYNQFSGAGVEIRPMIAGNIQNQPFYRKYVRTNYSLPGAEHINDCGFYFGNYPELTEADIEILRNCLSNY